jgi:DNA-directed RNA polymerase specialized sigma24 family protein
MLMKDILKNKLNSGGEPVIELLYTRYGGMLFSYILQFVPDGRDAEDLLVDIFSRLATRLQEACDSNLSIYCWLQLEARKIALEYLYSRNIPSEIPQKVVHQDNAYYFTLLEETSPEHQWVFRELFLYGRHKEELALQVGKDSSYIGGLLRECLLIIRKKLS